MGGRNSPLNIIGHLPLENLFFDSRHWNIWKTCEIAPTITTRTDACSQQYLFEIMELIMQRYGDRGGNVGSIRDYAHTIPANPMSDRGQMVVEIYEIHATKVRAKSP